MIWSFSHSFRCAAGGLHSRYAIDHVDRQVEAIHFVANRQFQRSIDIPPLHVSAHVNVGVVGPAISELVNEPGIAVEVEDDRLVLGEQRVEVAIR